MSVTFNNTSKLSREFVSFLNQLQEKYPYLSDEEELELRQQLAKGSASARDRLVFSCTPYVVKAVLSNPFSNSENAEDAIMDVFTEMQLKADGYEDTYNTKFITYMRFVISNAIQNSLSTLSVKDRRFACQITQAKKDLGEKASDSEIADYLGVEYSLYKNRVECINRGMYKVSMDAPINGEDGEESFGNFLEDRDLTAEEVNENYEEIKAVYQEIKRLSLDEREVIELYFNLNGNGKKGLSLRGIAKIMGTSHTTVGTLLENAKAKLRTELADWKEAV